MIIGDWTFAQMLANWSLHFERVKKPIGVGWIAVIQPMDNKCPLKWIKSNVSSTPFDALQSLDEVLLTMANMGAPLINPNVIHVWEKA